jgi:hypothetical protein
VIRTARGVIVEFNPTEEYNRTMAVAAQNLAAMQND